MNAFCPFLRKASRSFANACNRQRRASNVLSVEAYTGKSQAAILTVQCIKLHPACERAVFASRKHCLSDVCPLIVLA